MPQHHLDALEHALRQKGWKIVSTRTLQDYPGDFHTWCVERGAVQLEIRFERLEKGGEDVTPNLAYGCHISGYRNDILYFGKSPRFERELGEFLRAMDRV